MPDRRLLRALPRILAAALAAAVLLLTAVAAFVAHSAGQVSQVVIEDEHYDPAADLAPAPSAASPTVPAGPSPATSPSALPSQSSLPPASLDPSGPLSILILGSDSRSGKGNKGYGQVAGERSDTAMLVRVDAGHTRALVVSVPRDLVMNLPSCRTSQGTVSPGRTRFNAAFASGGAACAMRAVEKLTGSRVDHVVVVDFRAFKHATTAVGGVPVCLPRAVKDPYSGLNLSAGWHLLSGEQALSYVRARHSLGDGSDISRIARQQEFVRSLASKLMSRSTLTDPRTVFDLVSRLSSDLSVDADLSAPQDMAALALSLSSVRQLRFQTLPWRASGDGATVVLDESSAAPLLGFLRGSAGWPRLRASDELPTADSAAAPALSATAPSATASSSTQSSSSASSSSSRSLCAAPPPANLS